MATKPATVPSIWSPGANYTTGPFVGQPTKVIPAGAVALDGHRPGSADPTPGEYVNYQDHWTTTWVVDWLSQGSATAAGNTHIVETDSDGRTELVGLDLTDAVDRVLCNWAASNTAVPAILLDTGGGGGIQVRDPGTGAGLIASKTGGAGGTGLLVYDDVASTPLGIDVTLFGGGQLASMVAVGATVGGVYVETVNTTGLTINTIGNGAPLNLSPKAVPAAPVAGDILVDSLANQLTFYNAVGAIRRVWSTQNGISRVIFNFPGVLNNVPAPQVLINQLYLFDAGKKYTVLAKFSVGRPAASTKYPSLLLSIGASLSPDYNRTIQLYQTGVGHLERDVVSMSWDYVSAGGLLAVVLSAGDSGLGAGNINVGWGSVEILGSFD